MAGDSRSYDPNREMTVIHSMDEVPDFASEAEEAAWWATHELSEELWRSLPRMPDHDLPPVRTEQPQRVP